MAGVQAFPVPSVRIPDAELDRLVAEDVPYLDLTTHVLGIGAGRGSMEYFTREACVLCGTEEAVRIAGRLGCTAVRPLPSGTRLEAGEAFLRLEGSAEDLHAAWKVCLNLFDHLSAVATKTRAMVDAAHAANPACEVLTTRKSMPGVKALLTKAVLTGGAFPHRLGLSETVLVFAQHMAFMGGFEGFLECLPEIRSRTVEKKLFVEATADEARALARAGAAGCGVDGVQLDKVPVEQAAALVAELRALDPHLTVIAAGGIDPGNVAAYAATGVDGLVTTAPFTAKPVDMSVRMAAADGAGAGRAAVPGAAPGLEVRTDRREDAFAVRRRVFMDEQGYTDEFDAVDEACVHVTLYADGELAGCTRVFLDADDPTLGYVGRVATLKEFRGRGLGAELMRASEEVARSLGARTLRLHSQLHAAGFYEKCGYARCSDVDYEDEGQPHLWMEKRL